MITQKEYDVNSSIPKPITKVEELHSPLGPHWLAVWVTFACCLVMSILMIVNFWAKGKLILLSERHRLDLSIKIRGVFNAIFNCYVDTVSFVGGQILQRHGGYAFA